MECLRELNKKDTERVRSDGQPEARQPSPQAAAAATESSPVMSQGNGGVRLPQSECVALCVCEHVSIRMHPERKHASKELCICVWQNIYLGPAGYMNR
jgi:hypothetical protein